MRYILKRISFLVVHLFFSTLFLSGCFLRTRSDIKENEQKQVLQQNVNYLQKTNADTNNHISELEDEIKSLKGKIEELENRISRFNPDNEKNIRSLAESNNAHSKKLDSFQEELSKQEQNINQLAAEINSLKSTLENELSNLKSDLSASSAGTGVNKKNPLFLADELFKKSEWKKAIIQYQKYRDENPKGKHFLESTYRIANCFQELGMREEAKTFYEEVLSRAPSSSEARKSKVKLKSLKK